MAPSVHSGELRRSQPDPDQSRHGGDGTHPRDVSPPAGLAERAGARENHEGAAGAQAPRFCCPRVTGLAQEIAALFDKGTAAPRDAARAAFIRLREELAAGRVRAAEPDADSTTGWRVNV